MKATIKRIVIFCIVLLLLIGVVGVAAAKPIVIKLGSPAPDGSSWNDALEELAAEWGRITNGQVQVRIFPNGVAGDERDMIRKMRINTIQAAVISGAGLNDIAKDSVILNLPFFIHSEEELDYVFARMRPELEAAMEKAGFIMMSWTKAGWLYFFSRDPVIYPADLRKQKMAATDVDVAMAPTLKKLGFGTVTLSLNEIMAGLAGGMVDACYTVPLGAIAYQWFGIANNMCQLPMAPVMGGIIVSKNVWRRIPDEYKDEMLAASAKIGRRLENESDAMEREMMNIMRQHGLIEHSIPADAEEEWRSLFSKAIEELVGDEFPRKTYEETVSLLEDFRN